MDKNIIKKELAHEKEKITYIYACDITCTKS